MGTPTTETTEPGRTGELAAHTPKVVMPRWIQLVLLPLVLLGAWELMRAIGPVLLIIVFAGLMALMLNPAVTALQRRRVPRGLAIPIAYLAVLALIGFVGALLSTPIATQVGRFQADIPSIVHNANRDLASIQTFFNDQGIPVHIQQQGHTALQTLEKGIAKRSSDIVSFSSNLLQKLATISFDLVLAVVLSIYFLVYSESIGRLVRRLMPPGDGTPADDYPHLVQRAVLGYVRGQLLFSFTMGASATLALWIFGSIGLFPPGTHYAVFFGAFYGLMEMIPFLGPFLGALPPVIVALVNQPIDALWVAILFTGLQQLEGHVVAPQMFRISLRINPILIILALLIGDQIYGIAGALLALPVAAVIRETVLYLRRHVVLEPWTAEAVGLGHYSGVRLGPDPPPEGAEPATAAEPESDDTAPAGEPDPPAGDLPPAENPTDDPPG